MSSELKVQIPEIYQVHDAVNMWFELSYAQYLTIPRSVMEAMPIGWQQAVASLLGELDDTIDWRPEEGRYWVQLKDDKGRFISDELREYRHPRKGVIKFKNLIK